MQIFITVSRKHFRWFFARKRLVFVVKLAVY